MPQAVQSSAAVNADIRPPLPSARRDAPTDSFSQLLDAVGNNTAQPQDDTPAQNADQAAAQPPQQDQRTDRSGRRDRTDRQGSNSDTQDDQGTSAASDNPKKADDSSANQDGQPKEHKDKKGGGDASATAGAATPQTGTDAPVTASTETSTVSLAVAVPPAADNQGNDAKAAQPDQAAQPVDAKAPQAPVPQTPSDLLPQPAAPQIENAAANAAQPDMPVQAQATPGANKPAPKAKTPAPSLPKGDIQAVGADDTKTEAKDGSEPVMQAKTDAAPAAEPKPAPAAAPKIEQPATQEKAPLPSNLAANPEIQGDKKSAAPAGNQETPDNALAKQFSADIQITSNTPFNLPNTTPAVQANFTPASVAVQTSAAPATNQPVPLQAAALAVEIASRSKEGSRQFDIRLDPPELGRIDVKLDVDKSGQVNTHLTVDRPETLDLLRRDSQGLERALQQAGLKTSDGGLEFSLRQQTTPDGSQGRNQAQAQPNAQQGGIFADGDSDQSATIQSQYQWAARLRGGVDIRV